MSWLCKILVKSPLLHVVNKKMYPKLFIRKYGARSLNKRDFIALRVLPRDYDDVMELFWEYYFKAEPTVVGTGLSGSRNAVFQNKIYDSLSQGLSLMVKCKHDGSLVGAAINTAVCQWEPGYLDSYADTCSCLKMAQLLHLYAHITRAPNLWCKYCETKIFEVTYLTTRISDKGRGVGFYLIQKSLELGKDLSYTLLRVDATSYHTQKICKKLGMKLVYELPYSKYKTPDGNVLVKPPPPHSSVQVYIDQPLTIERTKELMKKK